MRWLVLTSDLLNPFNNRHEAATLPFGVPLRRGLRSVALRCGGWAFPSAASGETGSVSHELSVSEFQPGERSE